MIKIYLLYIYYEKIKILFFYLFGILLNFKYFKFEIIVKFEKWETLNQM